MKRLVAAGVLVSSIVGKRAVGGTAPGGPHASDGAHDAGSPRRDAREVSPSPRQVHSDAGHAAKRVLVVDDNADSADTLAILVRFMGADVRTANDGRQALAIAGEFRPEIVFLDISLPGMSGYEVAVRLRKSPETCRAMLVAMTGWSRAEDRQRSREAGCDHHLVKPFDPAVLQELIEPVPER